MNKFEQLIEYVINDEEQKARDLFHEIVVEKSRGIYEELMCEDEMDIEVDSDDVEVDGMGPGGEEEMDSEFETMEGTELEEAINLKAAPAPVKSEEGNINKKSTVAATSGAKGMDGKPVMSTGADEKGRSAPTAKNIMTGEVQNAPAKSTVKMAPATKPHLAQATGVNTKSPL